MKLILSDALDAILTSDTRLWNYVALYNYIGECGYSNTAFYKWTLHI
jgi:hypothetical protein